MKFIKTINTPDYTLVITRENDKQDGEYTVRGHQYYKKLTREFDIAGYYVTTIKDGVEMVERNAELQLQKAQSWENL